MIKAQTQIQRCKAQIIRAEESQRSLSGIYRRHKCLCADNRDLFFRVIQYDPADPLINAQIQRNRYFGRLITENSGALLVIVPLFFFTVLALGVLLCQFVIRVLHGKINRIEKRQGRFKRAA